jgi:hypothetical protein
MPRYFCDYCDAYLTHDSAPGRQQHIRGKRCARNWIMSAQNDLFNILIVVIVFISQDGSTEKISVCITSSTCSNGWGSSN